MIRLKNLSWGQLQQQLSIKKPWDEVVIFVLNLLITIPGFIIIHQNSRFLDWPFYLDKIVLLAAIVIVIQLLLRAVRRLIIGFLFLYLLVLLYGTLVGGYGFVRVYQGYNAMVYTMANTPHPEDIIVAKLLPFPNKSKILSAIEYKNHRVRNFAIMATNKHFKKFNRNAQYRNIIQCFAVFKEINSRWNYVYDPKNGDYIATASESIQYLAGDCDDHSIFMAACIRAIGGTPRLIHTKGHLYPEILIGTKKNLEEVNILIKKNLFVSESRQQQLYFHVDEYGQIWLNLDYTAKYPGGPFLSKEILGVLHLN